MFATPQAHVKSLTRKLTTEQKAAIPKLIANGESRSSLAERWGVSVASICWHLKRAGVQPKKRPTEDQRKQIVEAYLSGQTMDEAAAMFGFSDQVTFNALRDFGITHRHKRRPTEEECKQMAALHESGLSAQDAAAKLGFTAPSLISYLSSIGKRRRNRAESNALRWPANHSYFNTIDSEEKAYFFGLISADGCVIGKTKTLQLSLQERDHAIVERLAFAITGNKDRAKLSKRKRDQRFKKVQNVVSFGVSSTTIFAALGRCGIVPRKSLVLRPWRGPEHLMRHYWRGLVDGDGFVHRGKNRSWLIGLCGSKWCVNGFERFVRQHTGWKFSVRPAGKIFTITYGGTKCAQDVAKLLYAESTIHIERKNVLAQELIGLTLANKWRYAELTKQEYVSLKRQLGSWPAVAKHLGTSSTTLRRTLRVKGLIRKPPKPKILYPHITKSVLLDAKRRCGKWVDAAASLGLPRANLPRLLRQHGITPKRTVVRDLSAITKDVLEEVFSRLGSWKLVKEELDINAPILTNLKRTFGIALRNRSKKTLPSLEEMSRLRKKLGTWEAVAGHFGVGYVQLWNWRKRQALPVGSVQGPSL